MPKYLIYSSLIGLFIVQLISSCQSKAELDQAKYYVNGMSIYQKSCQSCHGKDGKGLGLLVPPLTDTLHLNSRRDKLACIIKNGTKEKLVIHGQEYEEEMKGFPTMTDMDIAQVIVYITNSFGNNQGMYNYNQIALDLAKCN